MRHAAPGSARAQPGRREGGRRRAGKRRSEAQPPQREASDAQDQVASWGQLPYWLTVVGICCALVIMRLGTHDLKSGTLVLAGVLLAAALARLVLPERRAGMLSSRRRLVDVAIFVVFGLGLLVAGLGVQAPVG
jgi:hypothetical protein